MSLLPTGRSGGSTLARLASRAKALTFAARHPETPQHARWLAIAVLAYAASPIDLIPDFIPVVGHLDDLVIVPIGFWLAVRAIPDHVWAECMARAEGNEEA